MQVKVFNENVHPYSEKFRGKEITIGPNEYIEMDEDEAEYFKGTFTFPVKNGEGLPDPRFFKKIRIEKLQKTVKEDPLVCHANGQKVASASELKEVLSSFAHLLVKDEKAEEENREQLKKTNADLRKQNKKMEERLESIETMLSKRLTDGASL